MNIFPIDNSFYK